MSTLLIPQEIFLLERYSSLPYFRAMYEGFKGSITAAEQALAQFMQHLPPGYRQLPQWQQPDITWGETVLVNLRWVLESLEHGLEQLERGDLEGLCVAGNVLSAQAGLNRDFSFDWMSAATLQAYFDYSVIASEHASNIDFTALAGWYHGGLTTRFNEITRGNLNPPESWPIYRVNPTVRVRSDDRVKQSGIYVPEATNSCAQLLIAGHTAAVANIGFDPKTGHRLREEATTWTLVERIADSGGGVPGEEGSAESMGRLRVEGGQACTRDGWWLTPVRAASRRYFKAGELMPDYGAVAEYGQTIWQWDVDQSSPALN